MDCEECGTWRPAQGLAYARKSLHQCEAFGSHINHIFVQYDRVHATGYLSKDAAGIDDKAMSNITEIRARMEEVGMKGNSS